MKQRKERKYSKKRQEEMKLKVLELLASRFGIIRTCLKEAGISTTLYYKWLREDEVFSDKVDDIMEQTKDKVELKLFKLISEDHPSSVHFYLKTKCKDRGYVDKQILENHVSLDEPVKITIVKPDED